MRLWALGLAAAETFRVAYLGASTGAEASSDGPQFSTGFVDFFGGEMQSKTWTVDGQTTTMEIYSFDTASDAATIPGIFAKIGAGQSEDGTVVGEFHAAVAGTSKLNGAIKPEAEAVGIVNIHCSGGNPASWLGAAGGQAYAFGMHLPFITYTRGPLRMAALNGMKTLIIVRTQDHGFSRASAISAMQWAHDAGYTIIGPSKQWCDDNAYLGAANAAWTCRLVGGNCRCGYQSEVDAFKGITDIEYNIESGPTFYEVSESATADGFNGGKVTPAVQAMFKSVFEDAVAQTTAMGLPAPEVVHNHAWMGQAAQAAMKEINFSPKVVLGWQSGTGTTWASSTDVDGNQQLTWEDGVHAIGFGQWHFKMGFQDPLFGSNAEAVNKWKNLYGSDMGYNSAGAVAAGVVLYQAMATKLAPGTFAGKDGASQRQAVLDAVSNVNDETMWGLVRFNAFNQNSGRGTAAWQVLVENGEAHKRCILPQEAAEAPVQIPFSSWEVRAPSGCPAGTYASAGEGADAAAPATECVACPAGQHSATSSVPEPLEVGTMPNPSFLQQSTCTVCPAGTGPSADRTACVACPAGTSQDPSKDGGVCTPCAAGSKQPLTGQATCEPCHAGFFSDIGAEDCDPCAKGSFAAKPGSKSCEPCLAGSFSDETGAEVCKPCELGFYEDQLGAEKCQECPETMTTLKTGATDSTKCTCGLGFFWKAAEDVCEDCPLEAYCPGGYYLPVVREGKYGLYVGSIASHDAAIEAKRTGTFNKGEYSDALSDMFVYNCRNDNICPGEATYEDATTSPWDLSHYGAGTKVVDGTVTVVRSGSAKSDLGSSCVNGFTGIACGRCKEKHYGRTECSECSGGAAALNVVIILLLPFAMIVLYRLTSSKDTRRVQTAFIMVSTFGMGAFVIQTVAVFDGFAIHWPIELGWVFNLGDIFLFEIGGMSVACLTGQEFGAKYWFSMAIPAVIIFMTAVGFGMTKALPFFTGEWVMQPSQTFNMLGMLFSALFVTLVKIVVAWWECSKNPTVGKETLLKYRDVECGSDAHNKATVPMVIGLLVYVIGFYVKFLHVAFTAPDEWPKIEFRERWRFMVTRWRPDVWFWGVLVMTRNLLVALAGVVSTEPRVQLIYLVWVVTTIFTVTAVWQPWRVPCLNIADVLSCVLLNGIGVFGLVFVSLDDEIELNTRLGRQQVADSQESLQSSLAIVLCILFGAFVAVFLSVIVWALALLMPGKQAEQAAKVDLELTKLYEEAIDVIDHGSNGNIKGDLERLVFNSTDHDRSALRSLLTMLRTSPEVVSQTGYFGTKKGKGVRAVGEKPAGQKAEQVSA